MLGLEERAAVSRPCAVRSAARLPSSASRRWSLHGTEPSVRAAGPVSWIEFDQRMRTNPRASPGVMISANALTVSWGGGRDHAFRDHDVAYLSLDCFSSSTAKSCTALISPRSLWCFASCSRAADLSWAAFRPCSAVIRLRETASRSFSRVQDRAIKTKMH